MKTLCLLTCIVLLTSCQARVKVESKPYPEPDGTSQTLKIADLPIERGVYIIRDYEHGQLCTVAVLPLRSTAITCQPWELPAL